MLEEAVVNAKLRLQTLMHEKFDSKVVLERNLVKVGHLRGCRRAQDLGIQEYG